MDELRQACAEVARRARSVRIDDEALAVCAVSLQAPVADVAAPDRAEGWSVAQLALHWLGLDAINFGSGWFPTLRKPDGRSGYRTIAAAWHRHAQARGPLDAAQLRDITTTDVAEILGQERDHALMGLYARSLNDLGARLLARHRGRADALVDAAEGSAVAFARTLGEWPCYADHSRYEELSLPFLKRAQIAATDLRRAGVTRWRDEHRLTMFADNLVPHVLRLDGVLMVDPRLVARIDAGALIAHGSREEIELRACAVEAVERIVAVRHGALTAADVDELLWNRGQQAFFKARPRHRTRCTAY